MAEKYGEGDGVWRTVGGRKVFIRNGQSLSEAMIASGKFKNIREDYRTAKEQEAKENLEGSKTLEEIMDAIKQNKLNYEEEIDAYSIGDIKDGYYVQFQDREKHIGDIRYGGKDRVESYTWARVWKDGENVLNINEPKYVARDKVLDFFEKEESSKDDALIKDIEDYIGKNGKPDMERSYDEFTEEMSLKYKVPEEDVIKKLAEAKKELNTGFTDEFGQHWDNQEDYEKWFEEEAEYAERENERAGKWIENVKAQMDAEKAKENPVEQALQKMRESRDKAQEAMDRIDKGKAAKDLLKQIEQETDMYAFKEIKEGYENGEYSIDDLKDQLKQLQYDNDVQEGLIQNPTHDGWKNYERKASNYSERARESNNPELYEEYMKNAKNFEKLEAELEQKENDYKAKKIGYEDIRPLREEVYNIKAIKKLEEDDESVIFDKRGRLLFNPNHYDKDKTRKVGLGIDVKSGTAVKDKEMLDSVIGQISDGIWENSPGQDKYWENMSFEQHGDEITFATSPQDVVYKSYKQKYINNPFAGKNDEQVKDYLANKIKQIVKVEMDDNGSIGKWDRNNQNTLSYLGYNDDVTVAEAYNLYDRLKGRTPKQSKSMNDILRNEAYNKYLKEHPGSKITLDEFLKKK